MKKLTIYYRIFFLLLTLSVLNVSCNSEFDNSSNFSNSTKPPVITSVNEAREDIPVSQGVLNNFYYIKGENLGSVKSIKYNGVEAGFNPVYVTENLIISRIPAEAPYLSDINKLRLETPYGIAEYDFSLITILGFDEEIVDNKSVVIINGGDFTNADRVVFVSGTEALGNLVEREAEILTAYSTDSKLYAVVPDGVVQAFIYVFTSRGAIVQSASYGFNYPIFTDELTGWTLSGWDGSQELSSEIALGSTSIKRESNNWGGLSFFPDDNAEPLVFADYRTVSFQIYPANSETTKISFALNDFDASITLDLTPGEWNKFVIPLSDIYPAGTGPDRITRMDFQEFSGSPNPPFLFYVDQFGFIE